MFSDKTELTGAAKEVMGHIEKDKVTFLDLQFSDFSGNVKTSTIPSSNVKNALTRGVWIDGSSIEGFARIHESDMYLMPDPSTYALLPWRNNSDSGRVARLICDVYTPGHKPFEGDPRYILKKVVEEARSMGYEYFAGPECEFFLFPKDVNGKVVKESLGNGFYFTLIMDETYAIKREIMDAISLMGITPETSTHEVADRQHEIDIRFGTALKAADHVLTLKMATKFIAFKHNYYATFMPKPIFGINGSGMHVHQSLWRDGRNTFHDPNDPYGLSQDAYHFLAGQLKYAGEIAAVFAPTVNSYKRLTPGYEAPVYTSWAKVNRSALIRVPSASQGQEERATRLEIRSPDPSSNPYLMLAVLLKAGLEGIKQKLKAPQSVEENVFAFDDKKLDEMGIKKLPSSLLDAINEMENGTIVRDTFGEATWRRYIEGKREEWDEFRMQVTDWEVNRYLQNL